MISCEELMQELGSLLDEEVAPDLRQKLERHLSDCRPCRVIADSTRSTVKIVTGCRSFDLPPKLSAKIMAKIRKSGGGEGT